VSCALLIPAGSLQEAAAAAQGAPNSFGFFVAFPSRLELSERIGQAIKVIMLR